MGYINNGAKRYMYHCDPVGQCNISSLNENDIHTVRNAEIQSNNTSSKRF